MEAISMKPSSHMPLVDFRLDGRLLLEGRVIPEDVNRLFDPLVNFVTHIDVEKVLLNFNLEYFNTSTSKKILTLLKFLEANNNVKEILINWHYEDGDEDSLEMAEIYEECLKRSEFRFIMHPELVSLADKDEVRFSM